MAFDRSWDKLHTEVQWGLAPDPALIAFYEKHFKGTTGLTFVDLGCGVGANSFFLSRYGHKVYAVDAAQAAIDRLKGMLTDKDNILPICCDVVNFSLPDKSVDCVIEVALFEQITLEDSMKVMQNAKKYLKDGGRFFSRMATEPWPVFFHRSDYHRRVTLKDVDKMFDGFDRGINLGHYHYLNTPNYPSYHYIVNAKLREGS